MGGSEGEEEEEEEEEEEVVVVEEEVEEVVEEEVEEEEEEESGDASRMMFTATWLPSGMEVKDVSSISKPLDVCSCSNPANSTVFPNKWRFVCCALTSMGSAACNKQACRFFGTTGRVVGAGRVAQAVLTTASMRGSLVHSAAVTDGGNELDILL